MHVRTSASQSAGLFLLLLCYVTTTHGLTCKLFDTFPRGVLIRESNIEFISLRQWIDMHAKVCFYVPKASSLIRSLGDGVMIKVLLANR